MNKSSFNFTLTNLYTMVGITKQAHYKRLKQQEKLATITQGVINSALELRKEHKKWVAGSYMMKFNLKE